MMSRQRIVLGMVCLIMISGCQQVKELSADQARAFADQVEPEVENLLVGLSNKDYAMHSRDFDQDMLDTVDVVTFPSVYDEVIGTLGKYHSHVLSGVQSQNQYVIARYSAIFDNDPDVTVRVVFVNGDPEHKVTGLWFDSKLLRDK